ncbi:SDR family oxidoreductase [Nonomuraea terrae]|uniref:SDR family oxidoreductase n=1 Tax=Nonomuraea terrae TaxID=2530383 RepID=UPI001FE305B7|nr:SDR family oxidoreductase [Nonomuraea terrae]
MAAAVRGNAVPPGVIDTGCWDGLGEARAAFLEGTTPALPVGRVGTPDDVALTIEYAIRDTCLTGTVLTVDGGGRLKAA